MPLGNPGVTDPNCSPLGGFIEVTGDGNTIFEARRSVDVHLHAIAPATSPADRTVTATGLSPVGTIVSDTDIASTAGHQPGGGADQDRQRQLRAARHAGDVHHHADNTGDDPLAVIAVIDDQCSPLSGPTGDVNTNNLLDLTELWNYTCTSPSRSTSPTPHRRPSPTRSAGR